MNEKDKLENILTLTKSLNMLYINAVIESANEKVRKVFENGLDITLKLQDNIYQQMKDDGYYNVANLNFSDINKVLTKIKEQ